MVLTSEGEVLTNGHVVQDARTVKVQLFGESTYRDADNQSAEQQTHHRGDGSHMSLRHPLLNGHSANLAIVDGRDAF